MANTTITIRIDEDLKGKLQDLVNNLGMDITTFFIMSAKQAVTDQALPFLPRVKGKYDISDYIMAIQNTRYNKNGRAVISEDDEWKDETEWDEMFEQRK